MQLTSTPTGTVSISPAYLAAYRADIDTLEARGQREGLNPSELHVLTGGRQFLAEIDHQIANPPPPPAPPVPAALAAAGVTPSVWADQIKQLGREPSSWAERASAIEASRIQAPTSAYGLSAGRPRGRGV